MKTLQQGRNLPKVDFSVLFLEVLNHFGHDFFEVSRIYLLSRETALKVACKPELGEHVD